MIDSSEILYTWVDVQRALQAQADQNPNRWPETVARCFWDGTHFTSTEATVPDIKEMLGEVFGERYDPYEQYITLGTVSHISKHPIFFEIEEDEGELLRMIPLSLIGQSMSFVTKGKTIGDWIKTEIQLDVVHHAANGAASAAVIEQMVNDCVEKEESVLVVDFNFYSPQFHGESISLSQFLSMSHGDSDKESKKPLGIATSVLREEGSDGCYILAAYSRYERRGKPIIEPKHLNTWTDDWFVHKLVVKLAEGLGVSKVIINLPPGAHEDALMWLYCPFVEKHLVRDYQNNHLITAQNIKEKLVSYGAPIRKIHHPYPVQL